MFLKKQFLAVSFIFIFFSLNAQKETNNWLFVKNNALNFNCNPPISLPDVNPIDFSDVSSISDQYGKLLFFTDGYEVYNSNSEIMMNGEELVNSGLVNIEFPPTHGRVVQIQSIIIPKPNNPNIYYIFYCVPGNNNLGLYYAEVDMTLNGGLGGVTSKRNLLATRLSGSLTAVAGKDCYWLVVHGFERDKSKDFLSYKVTATGVETTPVVSTVGSSVERAINSITGVANKLPVNIPVGVLKLSPDGKKIVSAVRANFLELLDFDDVTGQVSNALLLSR